jgi:menaquinol-cytochrome c reductase iron-sulfur subunit
MPDPSPVEQSDVSRRGFVGWAFGVGATFVGLVVGIPMVGSVLGSLPKAKPGDFVAVTEVAALTIDEPTGLSFVEETQDAYNYELLPHSVWAVKRSDTDVLVLSPVCTHLGCQVYWSKPANQYLCPCHGSVFGNDGAVVHGPAPRALDSLPTKIDKGVLYVQWVNYKPGVPTKIPV